MSTVHSITQSKPTFSTLEKVSLSLGIALAIIGVVGSLCVGFDHAGFFANHHVEMLSKDASFAAAGFIAIPVAHGVMNTAKECLLKQAIKKTLHGVGVPIKEVSDERVEKIADLVKRLMKVKRNEAALAEELVHEMYEAVFGETLKNTPEKEQRENINALILFCSSVIRDLATTPVVSSIFKMASKKAFLKAAPSFRPILDRFPSLKTGAGTENLEDLSARFVDQMISMASTVVTRASNAPPVVQTTEAPVEEQKIEDFLQKWDNDSKKLRTVYNQSSPEEVMQSSADTMLPEIDQYLWEFEANLSEYSPEALKMHQEKIMEIRGRFERITEALHEFISTASQSSDFQDISESSSLGESSPRDSLRSETDSLKETPSIYRRSWNFVAGTTAFAWDKTSRAISAVVSPVMRLTGVYFPSGN